MSWQPIETAPRDGTIVLYWSNRGFAVGNSPGACVRGNWEQIRGSWFGSGDKLAMLATHWMPLPPPPEAA